ncbi:hypothetical protein FLT15_16365 [Paenibacillus thiaminolyticus]|uniref:Gp37-like protein n=1 Tax=Paenibacillus thiaminolyticus TaxID=49283 RepID=UPI0011639EB6|nr:hypothetical protein [Paenibacillus thiaminolyticus]
MCRIETNPDVQRYSPNTNSFQYEKDWDLGDIVTLQNARWGLTMDARITEVKEIYEPASKIEIVLGNEIPTITKYVKSLRSDVKGDDKACPKRADFSTRPPMTRGSTQPANLRSISLGLSGTAYSAVAKNSR